MGFFNLSQDEQARIDAMPGTSEVPPAGALEGLATAIPKGIAGAGVKVGTLLNDTEQAITGGLERLGLHPSEPEPDMHRFGLPPIPEEEQRARSAAAVKVVTDWAATGSDPRVTGTVGRIAAGTAEGITIGVAGNEVAGPWGAASLLGTTEGYSSYKETKAQGADDTTALEVGGLTGVFAAASAFLPLKFGKTLFHSVIGGGAANVTLGGLQRHLSSEVLEAHGYHEMASQYRIADGEAVAADLILGSAFGAFGHATARRVNPADVDAASAVAAENHYNRSAPGVPTDPQTATAHADTMAGALHDLANGDLPDIPPERAQQLVDNVVPDPAHSWAFTEEPAPGFVRMYHGAYEGAEPHTGGSRWFAPNPDYAANYGEGNRTVYAVDVPADHPNLVRLVEDEDVAAGMRQRYGNSELPEDIAKQARPYRAPDPFAQAAHEELPGFESAVADIKPIDLPPEPPPVPTPEQIAEIEARRGAAAKAAPDVPLDDFHGSMLDHLVRNYGDERYVTEDGREVSYRELANEMQAQRNEADAFSKLHDVAAACAARNGV